MIKVVPQGLTSALILATCLSLPTSEALAQTEERIDSLASPA